jgi:aspartyl-tRNA(Asn)/glutamyl-tRNA(Gln) amidotransferase subunit A
MSFVGCWPRRHTILDSALPSAGAIASAVRSRRLSCSEVTERFLERARRAQAELNCFVAIDAEAAMHEAQRLDDALGAGTEPGLLAGVPFAAKDIFAHNGRLPTNGSRRVRLATDADSSHALDRLSAAGAVGLGWLNLDQFSYTATGTNSDFGSVRNPWDPARITGGSSSGAAAAVAFGAVPLAVGADTGGSARIPASYCGVVGFKPTLGRVSRRGASRLSFSQDSLGILARSVHDVSLALEVLAGHDACDPISIEVAVPRYSAVLADAGDGLHGIRIGVDAARSAARCTAEVQTATARALEAMAAHGAELLEVDLSLLDDYDVVASVLTWAEASAVHSQTFPAHREAYGPATRSRLDAALLSHGADHVNALRLQGRALKEFLRQVLSQVDVVVHPTTPGPPPLLRDIERDDRSAIVSGSLASLQMNRPFSLLGLPAMSLPIGFDSAELPVGLQLVGRPWAESTLLRCGATYQEITDWHLRLPPIAATSL